MSGQVGNGMSGQLPTGLESIGYAIPSEWAGKPWSRVGNGTVAAADTKVATGIDTIKGKITSIDTVKNTITLKELKTKADVTITVDPKIIATLKVGNSVKITSKAGSNMADTVKVLTPKVTPPAK